MLETTLTLPAGRRIALAPAVSGRLMAGVACLSGILICKEPNVWTETETLAAELLASHAGKSPSAIPQLKEARDLYKSFGMDPSRHRPSSEALLRRVLVSRGLYRLNNAVDCCNLASLRFLLPIGMYDLLTIDGDITLRVGLVGEEYQGIGKGPVHLADRLGLFDAQGPFGSPTSDSFRTRVTDVTTEILAVLMATACYDQTRMREHLVDFCDLFARHCRARTVAMGVLGGIG